MYDPENARTLLALGNNLARKTKPEPRKFAELTIPLPREGWFCILGRSDRDTFTDDGFSGDFDQLQTVSRIPLGEQQDRDIIISTGEGVDPKQHPFRTRLPEHMRSQLTDGDITITSVKADSPNDTPIESRADEVISVVDGLITMLGQLAAQNTPQNNVQ